MKYNNKGFTILEVTMTIFVLAMISVPLYFVLSDSTKQAHLVAARDHIKQESNKVFKILENDLSQAKRKSFSQEANEFSIKIRTVASERETDNLLTAAKENHDAELKYTLDNHNLYRTITEDGITKKWLVSNSVDSIVIDEPSSIEAQTSPGKMVVTLVMKSNLVGIKDDEQPKYEQNKVIIIKEDATSVNDPNWLDVGVVGGVFQTDGNLLADLKEQFAALGENFVSTWAGALGDIKGMTVDQIKNKIDSLSLGELKSSLADVRESLRDLKDGIAKTNKQIGEIGWQALYDQMEIKTWTTGWGPWKKAHSNEDEVKKDSARKEQLAQGVKNLMSGYKGKSEMNWDAVKAKAGSELNENGKKALEGFFQAKESQFDGINQLTKAEELLNQKLSSGM